MAEEERTEGAATIDRAESEPAGGARHVEGTGAEGGVGSAADALLAHSRAYAASGAWRELAATGRPAKRLAIVTCMDTRLTRLLPDALGLANGDAVIIKVAGATIVDPYGEAMRSLLVAVGELGVDAVMVIGHTNCGTCGMEPDHLLGQLEAAGTERGALEAELAAQPRARRVLTGFSCLEDEVRASVQTIRSHPLMPARVCVRGFTIDIETGELAEVGV